MASIPLRPSQPSQQLNEKERGEDLGPDDSISVVSPSSSTTTTTSSGSGSQEQPHRMTPTSSSVAESTPPSHKRNNIPYITRNSAPGPGSTYIIAYKPSAGESRALTVVKGRLRLATPPELLANPPVLDAVQAKAFAGTCNWHWHCTESDGWLGFQNAASGLWLGTSRFVEVNGVKMVVLDSASVTSAGSGALGVDEQFCVRKAANEEGYVLLKRINIGKHAVWLLPVVAESLQQIAAIDPVTPNVGREKLAWEFVKVDHDVEPETRVDGIPL